MSEVEKRGGELMRGVFSILKTRFQTIGPVKAGWLAKEKGIWAITDEGRKAYERFKGSKSPRNLCGNRQSNGGRIELT